MLPQELTTKIYATIPNFEAIRIVNNGRLPITQRDAPYNKKLLEKYGIGPVPFAAGLYRQLEITGDHSIISATINSGVHEHFLTALDYRNIASPLEFLTEHDLWSVTSITSLSTLKYITYSITALEKIDPQKLSEVRLLRAPEVLPILIEANERQGTLEEFFGNFNLDISNVGEYSGVLRILEPYKEQLDEDFAAAMEEELSKR